MAAIRIAAGVLEQRTAKPSPYANDPVGWVRDRLHEHPWSKQVEILEALRDHRRVAVHSCHGAGKSFIAARAACWWLDTRPPSSAFVVTSAPTDPQVKAILWREIRKAHRKGQLPGRVNQREWYLDSTGEHYTTQRPAEDLVGYGRKPADQDEYGFQGIHARYVLVVLDEAAGIPRLLREAVNKLVTNEDCRVLEIGNPDHQGSDFHKVCSSTSGRCVIHIDAYETPNFTGEEVPPEVAAELVSPVFAEQTADDYGEDSPQVTAQVRGLFPEDNQSGIVPRSWVARCQTPAARAASLEDQAPIELGVDVGAGGDPSVIRERRGRRLGRRWEVRSDDPEEVGDAVLEAVATTGATAVKVDSIGVGWGIVGYVRSKLRDQQSTTVVYPVNVAEQASEPDRFVDLRAELWWKLGRVRSRKAEWDLSAADKATVEELTAPMFWEEQKGGRIRIESKDDLRLPNRLGRSTNDADALLLAYYEPRRPRVQRGREYQSVERRRTPARKRVWR